MGDRPLHRFRTRQRSSRQTLRVLGMAVAVVLSAVTGCAQSAGTAETDSTAGLSQHVVSSASAMLDKFVADGRTPGAVVEVSTPDGVWTHTAGRSATSPDTPMYAQLQHRIGSITKTFTTTLILQLVQEGKVGLDDPVSRYVEGVPNGDRITLRMLGTMTAGLSEYLANPDFRNRFFEDPMRVWTPSELLDASYALGAQFPPGTDSDYSNANTVLLGLVVEKVAGAPFGDVLTDKILRPRGLDHTVWPVDASFPQDHVLGYTTLDPVRGVTDSTSWSPTQAYSAGQMISTAGDLTQWIRLLGRGDLLTPELQAERLRWQPLGDNDDNWHYTFGLEENSGWIGHNGAIPGYMSYAVYHPALDATIVLLINSDAAIDGEPPVNVLLRDLSPVLFPEQPVRVPVVR
ncbi:serine hydrolase domain-containing protein [Rhodococcus opacus]|uniref:Putative S12 family peptidase n=1 Tax=Rhodococcus opacus (strain B4) TaxID=632772 RepID=C1ASP0_RHOOB|nr:serine hydrolase domain-containing protein [Rhodococcus opacus]BAH48489.1 putative S12 family peptidase [Rhodococcus opacus B4]